MAFIVASACGRTELVSRSDDAGAPDAGSFDAGAPDAGTTDAGVLGRVRVVSARLPSPRHEAAVFSDGRYAWVLGGEVDAPNQLSTTEIVRYEPATDSVVLIAKRLPSARNAAAVAWTGQVAYLFGGRGDRHVVTDEILRFDPATGDVTRMNAVLPRGRYNQSAVWTGSKAIVVGGFTPFEYGTEVLEYDPVADRITQIATMPQPREGANLLWDGQRVWIVGGYTGAVMLDSLLALDPISRELTVSNLRWPFTHWESAMVWNGRSGWFLGGGTLPQRYLTSIVRFDPGAGVIAQLPIELPSTRIVRAGVWVGDAGFVFGGVTGSPLSPVVTDEILRFEP